MFPNDGRTIVEVLNTGGVGRNVTFVTPKTVGGQAVDDLTVSIPAGATRLFSRFSVDAFNQPAGSADQGTVYVNYAVAAPAELSVRVFRG